MTDDLPPVPNEAISVKSKNILDLETRLEHQTHARVAERFFFITVLVVVYDAHAFKSFQNSAGPICLTVLEAGGLYVLAELTGVRNMADLIRTSALRLAGRGKTSSTDDDAPAEGGSSQNKEK